MQEQKIWIVSDAGHLGLTREVWGRFEGFGGPGRDRTDDLFHAMEARSQLRHRPTCGDTKFSSRLPHLFSPTAPR